MNGYLHLLSIVLTALLTLVPGVGDFLGQSPLESQTIRRTLTWPSGAADRTLELSNVNGSVHIIAEQRTDVAVIATRTIEHQGASDDPGPQTDFRDDAGRLLVCGDASHCGCHINMHDDRRSRDDERTKVRVDFEVRVPASATLDICTINGGELRTEGTEGRYTLRNVNGAVRMERAKGAGRASTVNGDLEAGFVALPDAPSDFRTVNGNVKVTFPSSLSADLRLKTMNGGLYTDFDTVTLPTRASAERRNGRFVYRADRFASVRVGKGGPELTFETLNGDIQVRKH